MNVFEEIEETRVVKVVTVAEQVLAEIDRLREEENFSGTLVIVYAVEGSPYPRALYRAGGGYWYVPAVGFYEEAVRNFLEGEAPTRAVVIRDLGTLYRLVGGEAEMASGGPSRKERIAHVAAIIKDANPIARNTQKAAAEIDAYYLAGGRA